MMLLRLTKALMVASIALFFSIVCLDNVMDYKINLPFVTHVLSMDTTFPDSKMLGRAITSPGVQHAVYSLIMLWQGLTAIVCWWGALNLFRYIKAPAEFHHAKPIAIAGLTMGFLLYMVGFIIIGGEWFNMWQSANWNATATAGMFTGLIMFVLLYLTPDNDM